MARVDNMNVKIALARKAELVQAFIGIAELVHDFNKQKRPCLSLTTKGEHYQYSP